MIFRERFSPTEASTGWDANVSTDLIMSCKQNDENLLKGLLVWRNSWRHRRPSTTKVGKEKKIRKRRYGCGNNTNAIASDTFKQLLRILNKKNNSDLSLINLQGCASSSCGCSAFDSGMLLCTPDPTILQSGSSTCQTETLIVLTWKKASSQAQA